MSYHGIVTDMLPSGSSRTMTARTSQETNVSSLPVAIRPSSESSFQAKPDAVAAPNKNAYQSVMPGGETLAPAEPGYNEIPETSSRGDTKDRSMNYTMLNAAAKATQPAYQPSTYVPVATNISLSRLASAAASGATKRVAASSLPALVNAMSAAFNPAVAPVVVDAAPPSAPPVVVVEEEPWYKSPAVMGIGILLLVAGGYALYKSQGT